MVSDITVVSVSKVNVDKLLGHLKFSSSLMWNGNSVTDFSLENYFISQVINSKTAHLKILKAWFIIHINICMWFLINKSTHYQALWLLLPEEEFYMILYDRGCQ